MNDTVEGWEIILFAAGLVIIYFAGVCTGRLWERSRQWP